MSDPANTQSNREPSLGELLREARVERGLELGDVAGLTHVRREYLAALEEGRYADLPEDVYTKNFLRLYAQAVGFDLVRAQEIYRSERRDAGVHTPTEQEYESGAETTAPMGSTSGERRWWESAGIGPGWGTLLSTIVMVGAVVALALWGFNSTFFTASRGTTEDGPTSPVAPVEGLPGVAGNERATEPGEVPRTVRLSVTSTPSGAEVSVDEFPLPGTTPIESAPVTARPSRVIRVTLDGYEPYEAEFDLTFDRNLSFALTPQSPQSEVPPGEGEGGAGGGGAGGEADGDAGDPGSEGDAIGDAVLDETQLGEGGAALGGQGGSPAAPMGDEDNPQATLTIVGDTWLEVYGGMARNQGQRLAFTTARAGQSLSFPLPVFIYVGNAGGVELAVNGQARGALGSSGEVRGIAVTQ